jgi:hypothetical protein
MTELRTEPQRNQPRTPASRWKLIMAADEPWQGEVYSTRPGGKRIHFSSLEELVIAIVEQSGWKISQSPTPAARTSQPARAPRNA